MENHEVKNILLVGVGGQGTILVGKILSTGLVAAGYDVKMSEVHGMSQRGGSVSNQVRFGKKVFSPLIGMGQVDILVSFELMETMRWIDYLGPNSKALINDYRIPPAPVLAGKAAYPEGIAETLADRLDITLIRAADIAAEIGNPRTMNIVLLGALVKSMYLADIDWKKAIIANVKPQFVDINIAAYNAGIEIN